MYYKYPKYWIYYMFNNCDYFICWSVISGANYRPTPLKFVYLFD